MELAQLVRSNIKKMTAYSSARDEFESLAEVYLDANENPFPNGVNRYPDPHQKELKNMIAKIKKVDTTQILLGNGSDEILDLIIRSFCNPGKEEMIVTPPTYGMYKVLAEINDVTLKEVRLRQDFSLDTDNILAAITDNTKMILLCSPNNPSGNLLSERDITRLLQAFGGLVVIDEAYIDFCDQPSWTTQLDRYPNLIVCQTLSKAWGMAGLRLGLCFASAAIINVIKKVKPPYNINQLTQEKAISLLQEEAEYRSRLAAIVSERERVQAALNELAIVKRIVPSDANFLLVQFDQADEIYHALIRENIVTRNRSGQPLCDNMLRITIGLEAENNRLLKALKALS